MDDVSDDQIVVEQICKKGISACAAERGLIFPGRVVLGGTCSVVSGHMH